MQSLIEKAIKQNLLNQNIVQHGNKNEQNDNLRDVTFVTSGKDRTPKFGAAMK